MNFLNVWGRKYKIRSKMRFLDNPRDIYTESYIKRKVNEIYDISIKENWSSEYLDKVIIDKDLFDNIHISGPEVFK